MPQLTTVLRCIAAGTNDNSVYVYDIESKHCLARLTGHGNDVNAVAYLQVKRCIALVHALAVISLSSLGVTLVNQ
jgi:WD40 repeat protein